MCVNAAFSSVGSIILNETYSWSSSANVWKSSWCCLIICPMGPVYSVNKTGPRTEPCGTPWSSSDGWDVFPPKQTECVFEVRYDANHWWAMPITPALLIRPNSSEWSTISNAADRSSMIKTTPLLLSRLIKISFCTRISAVSVLWFGL